MAVTDVKNMNGEKVSQAELPDSVFNVEIKSCVLNEVVKMQRAKRRSGTAAVKTRSAIKGSTGKLFRQKGTGRARRGDIKSPLLKGGGVVFGPVPRSYAQNVPKKVRKLALKMALSSKFQADALTVIDTLQLEEVKTKAFAKMMDALGTDNVLFVTDKKDETLEMSARNIPRVKVLRCEGLNVYDILKYKNLVLVESTISAIEGRVS
ncbi:MAG: 50S ribosomal protein L4 [Thermodesulfobacteriota bacterium]|nr:50S ribosomal protein L4 [Thermodesulfobacteriota bacterium]